MLPAKSGVRVETAEVRVTEWRLAPGPRHRPNHIHKMNYVMVPATSGELIIVAPNGERSKASESPGEIAFLEVKLKP
jgi:beta-alanine degradation protein BauB